MTEAERALLLLLAREVLSRLATEDWGDEYGNEKRDMAYSDLAAALAAVEAEQPAHIPS